MKMLGHNCIRFHLRRDLHVNLMWGKLASNHHGTQARGEEWNKETVRGPKFTYCKLDVHAPSTGHRIWFYFPSGKCWSFDVYLDRRVLQ